MRCQSVQRKSSHWALNNGTVQAQTMYKKMISAFFAGAVFMYTFCLISRLSSELKHKCIAEYPDRATTTTTTKKTCASSFNWMKLFSLCDLTPAIVSLVCLALIPISTLNICNTKPHANKWHTLALGHQHTHIHIKNLANFVCEASKFLSEKSHTWCGVSHPRCDGHGFCRYYLRSTKFSLQTLLHDKLPWCTLQSHRVFKSFILNASAIVQVAFRLADATVITLDFYFCINMEIKRKKTPSRNAHCPLFGFDGSIGLRYATTFTRTDIFENRRHFR